MKHNYTIFVEDKCILRPANEYDLENMRNWRNDEKIRRCFVNQNIITREQQMQWFENYLDRDGDIMFIIELNNKPIGTVALYDINEEEGKAEFGRIMIGDISVRGLGIGKKVTVALCKFGFNILDLNQIYLEVFTYNAYAINIYDSVGFKIEKEVELNNRKLYLMNLNKDSVNYAK